MTGRLFAAGELLIYARVSVYVYTRCLGWEWGTYPSGARSRKFLGYLPQRVSIQDIYTQK